MLRRLQSSRITASSCFAMRNATIIPLIMPALSPTMKSGGLLEWEKLVGQEVVPGDVYVPIQTDKAAMPFTNAGDDGFMARHLVPSNTSDIPVGTIIALLVEDEADIACAEVLNYVAPAPEGEAAPVDEVVEAAAPAAVAAVSAAAPTAGRVAASPLARATAGALGVDVSTVTGTGGANGRVTKDDVVAASKAPKAAAPAAAKKPAAPMAAPAAGANFVDIPTTPMRAIIAERLTQSKNVEVPHYYLSYDVKADNMKDVIKHLNAKGDGKYKISVNDFLIKAIARANLVVPAANTHWHDGFMREYKTVDVSVAVATPTGLITPIVTDAHAKGLVAVSQEVKELAGRAREGRLQPHEYQGGTVAISNMGGMGVQAFTAIINPPQSVILAVGAPQPRQEILKVDGQWAATGKIEEVITLTASFDHRVVDGAVGAQWFKVLQDTVENPLSMLL